MEQLLTDLTRLAIFVMFGLVAGQILWVIRLYGRKTKRLLPRHILTVGVAYLVALTEVAWQNAVRVGDEFSAYVPVNFAIMALSLYAMQQMRTHLRNHNPHDFRRRKEDKR